MSELISDSHATLDQDRLFAQHQAAVTVVQSRLQNPKLKEFTWLDLACGRGQIIAHLESNLTPGARAKVNYHFYDIRAAYVANVRKKAELLGFRSLHPTTDGLEQLDVHFSASTLFDFITFTNTMHELSPRLVARTLAKCILLLRPEGSLFVYDYESLPPPNYELGAIAWSRLEIQRIIGAMLDAFGIKEYRPEVGQWRHKTCTGWNVHLERVHMECNNDDLKQKVECAVAETELAMRATLSDKLVQVRQMLTSFTDNRPETDAEREERMAALFDFWAITRALEKV